MVYLKFYILKLKLHFSENVCLMDYWEKIRIDLYIF